MWEKDLSKSLIGIYYGVQVCYDFEFCDGEQDIQIVIFRPCRFGCFLRG